MDNCEGLSTVRYIKSDETDGNLESLVQDLHETKHEVIEVSPDGRFLKVSHN
jgi:hypothetical protein